MSTLHTALDQFQFSRTATLTTLADVEEKNWDAQPEGQPNTIRWNAGHIYIAAEVFLHKADQNYEITNGEWAAFFAPGTKPADWDDNVPSSKEIITALQEQKDRIIDYFTGKLQNPASEEFEIRGYVMNTVDANMQGMTFHEGMHVGIIKTINNVVK